MAYLFGPVQSRRLGRSLGIDLVEHKTCTLDCVYCECGKTTRFLQQPEELVPVDQVIEELQHYLDGSPELDYCTFSGSGEPTLHSGIGTVINYIRDNYPQYRVAVLTNGTLLHRKDVREGLMNTHLVMPSLDVVSEGLFQRMLRPGPGITAQDTVQGLKDFASEFTGTLSVEVFIIPGLNDTEEELQELRQVLLEINPQGVELNTLDRPGTEQGLARAREERLNEIKEFFEPLPVFLVGRPGPSTGNENNTRAGRDEVLATIRRRPSTMLDLKEGMAMNRNSLAVIVDQLLHEGLIIREKGERGIFFRVP